MDKHYTLMIIPEKEKGVRSFRIPGLFFRSFAFIFALTSILFGVFLYDYWQILQQIHENKHLSVENRQLREQIQLFQMKVNSLDDDLHRINTFEKKLRIITGLERANLANPIVPADKAGESQTRQQEDATKAESSFFAPRKSLAPQEIQKDPDYQKLKHLYDLKIARSFGLVDKYKITEKFSDTIKKSFELSSHYATFDYKFKEVKSFAGLVEKKIHALDQFLLDKESILMSTPTILPTNGWITSYFGHRLSPTQGVLKMHEGLDFGAPYGTNIIAAADGVVTYSGKKSGFGYFVQIDHGYGMETIYAHSQKIFTTNGQRIKRGDLIAQVGSTGRSTGPHLHYEVRVNGIAVDPLYFVLN